MFLVKPSFRVLEIMGGTMDMLGAVSGPLELIERAGRTCYKSEERMTEDSAEKFVRMVRERGHESVLEHSAMTVKLVVDRGVSHELVRHRLCAFSQESTRYCNYKGGVTFVIPPWVNVEPGDYKFQSYPTGLRDSACITWMNSMWSSEIDYCVLLSRGWSLQQARSVLPNSLKTEIVVTANFREWRHIFTLRTSKAAHPQMREIMIPLLQWATDAIPVMFEDIVVEK